MKTQKIQEQIEIKEESDSMEETQNNYGEKEYSKYGGKDYTEEGYSELLIPITNKDVAKFNEDECSKRLHILRNKMKDINDAIKEARTKGRETNALFQEKQNLEQQYQMVSQRLEQMEDKTDGQDDNENKLEKAKHLSRPGTVNIRPEKVQFANPTLKKKIDNKKK